MEKLPNRRIQELIELVVFVIFKNLFILSKPYRWISFSVVLGRTGAQTNRHRSVAYETNGLMGRSGTTSATSSQWMRLPFLCVLTSQLSLTSTILKLVVTIMDQGIQWNPRESEWLTLFWKDMNCTVLWMWVKLCKNSNYRRSICLSPIFSFWNSISCSFLAPFLDSVFWLISFPELFRFRLWNLTELLRASWPASMTTITWTFCLSSQRKMPRSSPTIRKGSTSVNRPTAPSFLGSLNFRYNFYMSIAIWQFKNFMHFENFMQLDSNECPSFSRTRL